MDIPYIFGFVLRIKKSLYITRYDYAVPKLLIERNSRWKMKSQEKATDNHQLDRNNGSKNHSYTLLVVITSDDNCRPPLLNWVNMDGRDLGKWCLCLSALLTVRHENENEQTYFNITFKPWKMIFGKSQYVSHCLASWYHVGWAFLPQWISRFILTRKHVL